jgi:Flp pilus assembly protein TadG
MLNRKNASVDASTMRRGPRLEGSVHGSWPRTRRRAGERGAALVEFAIVLPILLLVVFGIIDFGVAFADYQNVRSGTREAARLGVVNDLSNAAPCKINGSSVSPPTTPSTATDATNALVCKTKDRIGLADQDVKVKIVLTGQSVGDRLKVCATFPVGSLTGVTAGFLADRVLTSSVTMRLEQVPEFEEFTESGNEC